MLGHTLVAYALVMLVHDNSIVMLKRSEKASFEPGSYSLPGGRVEKNETFKQAVIREAQEELGIEIHEADLEFVHTFYRKGSSELVAVVFRCTKWHGELINKEPEKHSELRWLNFDNLSEKLIPAHRKVWDYVNQGVLYSEHF